jgi:hypothetical protein
VAKLPVELRVVYPIDAILAFQRATFSFFRKVIFDSSYLTGSSCFLGEASILHPLKLVDSPPSVEITFMFIAAMT